ncbi:BREX system P-loop protein BrxC [Candidatus Poribacteria bacterium]|nr:BREX system P-loop protein BrxC [Candidatus Poribacteria bacterium]
MKIRELFTKDISRPINGVVKADQQDDKSIYQELEEFVVTRELSEHLDRFFSVYLQALENPRDADAAGKMGVWVSGFFGSGKSHLIKVLHYLFKNQIVKYDGQEKQAIKFLDGKIADPFLFGNIQKAVTKDADVILFNIDSKADQTKSDDVLIRVFLKVLNELQGYSPDYPHIAHMERYLDQLNKLAVFEENFRMLTGQEWRESRVHWHFTQDNIVKALSETLGQSEEACQHWAQSAEDDFPLTIENFARWVKEYLDSRGSEHRIFFFVDEVGQFIGDNSKLMLNLQTITENLGTQCGGRAWLIVTSQEDMDKAIGSLKNTENKDFSKIQGRFNTRLSLSSANTDEVIQKRLLEKQDSVIDELVGLYEPNADILGNQLTFSQDTGMTLQAYQSEVDFVKNYPFIPYQFKLLQRVFEGVRRAGATGLHLSRGERSMLDAFQHAGIHAADKDTGVLVPLYWFYPSIESFLDTAVRRTIQQAAELPSLEEFDINIFQTLFMIRYIEEIKGNVNNLVTLCIDHIDSDKFVLRKKVEESLSRLEKETLISRSGENYFFLTNEE